MLHLMKCALNDLPAEKKPEECSWEMVYNVISKNDVQGLTYYAIEPFANEMPVDLVKKWKDYRNTVIYKKLMMAEEREAILSDLSKEGISFLQLKGCQIEKYYPKPGMRDMADNDILYGRIEKDAKGGYRIVGKTDKERRKTVAVTQKILLSYMKKRGYVTKGNYEKDDVCLKNHLYNFEMHRDLMDPGSEHLKYYRNPWEKAIPNEDSTYEFHYSLEDEYIFMVAHEYKHYQTKGSGVRNLADFYVFLRKENNRLDWDYINRELDTLKIRDFENRIKTIAENCMNPKNEVNPAEEEDIFFMCRCGVFGTVQNALQRQVKGYAKEGESLKKAKRRYYYRRFFPPDEFYEDRFPFFYKHKILRPFFTIYRSVRGVLFHSKHLKKEYKNISDLK
jgi:hypothetical protein